jgi:hypothetical protein
MTAASYIDEKEERMNKFLAVIILGIGIVMAPAYGDSICSNTTDCTLTFTQGNSGSAFGTGDFGTVNLNFTATNTVTITVSLASGFQLINTGFPGTFGFSDSFVGGLTIGNFSSPKYSGAVSDATNNQHFDGFGYVNDAAATSGPSNDGTNPSTVSFTVYDANLTNVNQLLLLSNPAGGDGAAYFIADVGNQNTTGPGAGQTGLIAVTGSNSVPDGGMTLMLLGGALVGLETLRRRVRA